MDQGPKKVGLNVRVPEALRYAIRQYALSERTTVAKIVNRLLRAELVRGGITNPAYADRG